MKVSYTNRLFDPSLPEGEVETILELTKYINDGEYGSYMVDEHTSHPAYDLLIQESGVEDYLEDHIDYFLLGRGKVQYILTREGEALQERENSYWD
jgi:hypothetical protein